MRRRGPRAGCHQPRQQAGTADRGREPEGRWQKARAWRAGLKGKNGQGPAGDPGGEGGAHQRGYRHDEPACYHTTFSLPVSDRCRRAVSISICAASLISACAQSTTTTPVSPTPPPADRAANYVPGVAINPVHHRSIGQRQLSGADRRQGEPLRSPSSAVLRTTSSFALGSTSVKCMVTDADQRADSCTFTVTVSPPPPPIPRISATHFVCFGDSMTSSQSVDASFRIRRVHTRPICRRCCPAATRLRAFPCSMRELPAKA